MLSFGFNWAQLDIGYRDHWFSPATDSTMMIGTEAPTNMPSVTLSNYEPLHAPRIFNMSFFLARMSSSDHILGGGQGTTLQSRGHPKLFGAQFSIEPVSGWSLGVNRQLQYGAEAYRIPRVSWPGLFQAGWSVADSRQSGSLLHQPFSSSRQKPRLHSYVQYAGENTLNGGSYLLGESFAHDGASIFPSSGITSTSLMRPLSGRTRGMSTAFSWMA